MDSFDLGRLAYLVLLGGAIVTYFVVENRNRLGKAAQQAVIWGLIFVGVVAAYGLWGDISRDVSGRESVMSDGRVEVPMAPDGHYYLAATVNGERIRFVVDTGASDIVLAAADARRIGLDPASLAYTRRAQTANGMVNTAPVSLDTVEFAGWTDRGIEAVVNAGDLDTSLLGMSYLSRFSLTLSNETLTLAR
jgi:aspartyl protease family protein